MTAISKASGDIIETRVDDEIIVVALASGELFSLKGTAADIWNKIDGERSAARICALLAEEFGCESAAITGDVDRFLSNARDAGLVAR